MTKKVQPRYIEVIFYLKNGKKKFFNAPIGYPYFFSKVGLFLVECLVTFKLESVFVRYTYVKHDYNVVEDTEDTYIKRLKNKYCEDNLDLPFE